jgi:hypothetical protein
MKENEKKHGDRRLAERLEAANGILISLSGV